MDDAPSAMLAFVADGDSDPTAGRGFTGVGVDEPLEAVHHREIAAGLDGHVARLGSKSRWEEIEHGFPSAAVCLGAAVLVRRDGVEEDDIRCIVLQEGIEISGAQGALPLVDQLEDFQFVLRGRGGGAHWDMEWRDGMLEPGTVFGQVMGGY